MQPGLADVAGDVDADPGAVFEANDADSVDELVDGGAPERHGREREHAVDRLFEGGLDRPERVADADRDRSAAESRASADAGRAASEGDSSTTPAVLEELERAVASSTNEDVEALGAADLEEIDDGDVEDALAAAAAIEDGDAAESVPAEWRDQ